MVEDNPIKNGRATGIVQVININDSNRSRSSICSNYLKMTSFHSLPALNLVGFHVAGSGVAKRSGILSPD